MQRKWEEGLPIQMIKKNYENGSVNKLLKLRLPPISSKKR